MCGRRMVVRSVGYAKAVDGGSRVEEDLAMASSGGARGGGRGARGGCWVRGEEKKGCGLG